MISIFDEGYADYFYGFGFEDCPYDFLGDDWEEWTDGWIRASRDDNK